MRAEIVAQLQVDAIKTVVPNDHARSSFTVVSGQTLHAIDGGDLHVLHSWRLPTKSVGSHASSPERGIALVCAADRVTLLGADGSGRWSFRHTPWSRDYVSGCAWFDGAGRCLAVVPAPRYRGCLVVHLDTATGGLLGEAHIEAAPAGITPIHQSDGWVALSEGEGQDAARAWWVRVAEEQGRIEIRAAGWDDLVLADVDPDARRVLTAPHRSGALTVWSFPVLDRIRDVSAPGSERYWDFTACFADEHLVARVLGDTEETVAIDEHGHVEPLDVGDGWLVGARHGSWLTVTRDRIQRRRLR